MTKLFLDFEFTGLHQDTTPISLGIVSEDNKTFYAEFNDYDESQVNDWIQENVINNLKFDKPIVDEDEYYAAMRDPENSTGENLYNSYSLEMRGNKKEISQELLYWLEQFDKVEIWSDTLAYDWVLFNQLFGHAFNIPDHVYYIPFDIVTLMKMKNVDPDINREKFANIINDDKKHNSLHDAEIIKGCYLELIKRQNNAR